MFSEVTKCVKMGLGVEGGDVGGAQVGKRIRGRLDAVVHGRVGSPHVRPVASIVTMRITPSLGAYETCVDILNRGRTGRTAVGNLGDTRNCVEHRLTHGLGLEGAPRVHFVLSRSVRCNMGVSGLVSSIAGGSDGSRERSRRRSRGWGEVEA